VLAAVLAAICSTADSQLVVAGGSVANDLYSRLVDKSGRTAHMILNRTTILVLGVAAVLMVVNRSAVEVFDYVLSYGWAVLGASFGPQIILALLWKRASYAGCIAGMLTGFLTAILWKLVFDNTIGDVEIYNLPLAFVAALMVNVLVSLAAPGKHRPPAKGGAE
jgi:sodium/proline symporter